MKPVVNQTATDVGTEILRAARRPEELVYRSCYAPVDLRKMLESADTRSKIRRLPASQIYFGLKELEDDEIQFLLPHITPEQWTGVLDLDLWTKDRMSTRRLIYWQRHIVEAEGPVARKLVRAADPEMWELAFKRRVEVYSRVQEGEYEHEPGEGRLWLETPDGNYVLVFSGNTEESHLLRSLILRLYELEPAWTTLLLESCRFRSSTEIEEAAYFHRTQRIEELGFQDYFQAIEIYTPVNVREKLPRKLWQGPMEMSVLPARLPRQPEGPFLLFQAFANLTRPQEIQSLVEELFYVCNKVLSADRISPANPPRIKKGIRKAISGMNLGLELWSRGDLAMATQAVRQFYLQSFFQISCDRLKELQMQAQEVAAESAIQPGSIEEAFVEGLLKRYPVQVKTVRGRRKARFFSHIREVEEAEGFLSKLRTR